MKLLNKFLFATVLALTVTSCAKKGCMDPTAANYDSAAEKMMENVIILTMYLLNMFLQMEMEIVLYPTQVKLLEWIYFLKW